MKKTSAIFICLVCCLSAIAADRTYIREQIQKQDNCRNVAITKYGAQLMLYGRNGWAGVGLPQGLGNALSELNDQNVYIDDVQITESGSWLILYGNNGFRWSGIPYSLENKIREWNTSEEVIYSVTFNDAGQWIAICENYYVASESWIQEWLKAGIEKYGMLWCACITDDAMVAVYAKGFKTYGNVPQSLWEALDEETRDVFRLKIAGTAWFYADINGSYRYYM